MIYGSLNKQLNKQVAGDLGRHLAPGATEPLFGKLHLLNFEEIKISVAMILKVTSL